MSGKRQTWRNRIVGTGEEAPDQLLANPANWRIHPKPQQDALNDALDDIGWIQQVVVNRQSGHLIDGHLRVSLAMRNNEPTVPVLYVDLDPREEALALATLDPIAAMAAADKQQLDALLREVDTGSAALQEMLSDLAAKSGLEYGKPEAVEDPGAQIDRAEELRGTWGTERGQLWEIPSATVAGKCHRLLCGDSTSAEDVARLYGSERLTMVWTDPPYGVSYGEKNRYLQSIGRADRLLGDIEGDQASPEQVYALVHDSLARLASVAAPGAVAYVAAPPGPLHIRFIQAMNDSGFEYRHQLVWLKNQLVFGRSDYMYKHEPILYGWLQNGAHYFEPVTNNCTVFEFNRPRASKLHPTEKPVELVAAMIQNSSHRGDIVGEPFSGSGTDLVASEQTARLCYAAELEPKYIAVALERLAGMGLEPRLTT